MASELPVRVSSLPVVSHRFSFHHGDETGMTTLATLSFLQDTLWPGFDHMRR
jgi:hypothetical protein